MLDALVRPTTGMVTVAASSDTDIDPGFLESIWDILDSLRQHNELRKICSSARVYTQRDGRSGIGKIGVEDTDTLTCSSSSGSSAV
jgi:hypothetical protein